MTPGGASTDALLDALDRVREVRGSVPLFDALVADDPQRVRATLMTCPRHPLHDALVAWLAARGIAPPEAEGAAAALARHGIADVDAYVAASGAREAALARALDTARGERDLALRAANAYALVAALLAIVAIVGWFGALGGFPLPEEPPPAPTPLSPRTPSEDP
ncbi:MAG: hypothetical protein Q8P41_04945 [Pseudomonadota bacterium]|nr:hypothetical protein [Pseudomonadota bacterium]